MHFTPALVVLSLAAVSSASVIPRQANFRQANIQQAIAETASYAKLRVGDNCTGTQNLCAGGAPAVCSGGKIVGLGSCAGGLTCMSLPLVNKPGTSQSTCDTPQDGASRMNIQSLDTFNALLAGTIPNGSGANNQAGGATQQQQQQNNTGNQNQNQNQNQNTGAQGQAKQVQNQQPPATGNNNGGVNLQANKNQAIAENQNFGRLSANSPCNANTQAVGCIRGQFAQCVNGRFQVTGCAGGLTCMSLPLLKKQGTSGASCDTLQDGADRMGITADRLKTLLNA